MKAIILAAGYATRLYPYTENYPKSLLKVGGKPLLEHSLESIFEAPQIDSVSVVTNHRFFPIFRSWLERYGKTMEGEPMDGWSADGAERGGSATHSLVYGSLIHGIPVTIVNDGTKSNEERLGSVGDMAYALRTGNITDDVLVICSDKLFTFSIRSFIGFFEDRGETVNTCIDTGDPESLKARFGSLVLDEHGRVILFQEKPERPESSVKSIAFYIYPGRILPRIQEYLDEGNNPDAPGYFSEWLCRREPMYGWIIDGECRDVGDPSSLRSAHILRSAHVSRSAHELHGGQGEERLSDVRCYILVPGPPGETTLARLDRLLNRLAPLDALSLVYLGIEERWASSFSKWLAGYPSPLPVNLYPQERGGVSEDLTLRLKESLPPAVSLYIVLDEQVDEYPFEGKELGSLLGPEGLVVVMAGRARGISGDLLT